MDAREAQMRARTRQSQCSTSQANRPCTGRGGNAYGFGQPQVAQPSGGATPLTQSSRAPEISGPPGHPRKQARTRLVRATQTPYKWTRRMTDGKKRMLVVRHTPHERKYLPSNQPLEWTPPRCALRRHSAARYVAERAGTNPRLFVKGSKSLSVNRSGRPRSIQNVAIMQSTVLRTVTPRRRRAR